MGFSTAAVLARFFTAGEEADGEEGDGEASHGLPNGRDAMLRMPLVPGPHPLGLPVPRGLRAVWFGRPPPSVPPMWPGQRSGLSRVEQDGSDGELRHIDDDEPVRLPQRGGFRSTLALAAFDPGLEPQHAPLTLSAIQHYGGARGQADGRAGSS